MATLGVAFVVGAASMSQAQGGGNPGRGQRPDMRMAGIDSTLSADQKTKLEEITKKYAPEQAEIRTMMQSDREGAMKKRADLTAKMNPEVRAVLTPVQQAIFDKNLEEMAKRQAGGGRPGGSPE
jgi:Spy/CpxP family protein refolding chaperone